MGAPSILLIGYGNPARRDDGLGPALAAAVDRLALQGVDVEADYQLTVEDAVEVARHDVVVFADAAAEGPEPYWFRPVAPAPVTGFSSHSVEPGEVLSLAAQAFGQRPRAFLLGIRGYDFSPFDERLSPRARRNLAAGLRFLVPRLKARDFDGAQPGRKTKPTARPRSKRAGSRG
jgi:hydrogenase maturation protease